MNRFDEALEKIKKNIEIQDDWTEEDQDHYNTIIFALKIASELCECSETENNDVKCKDCEHLELELPYAVCSKAYKGIVNPDDSCGKGKRKGGDNNEHTD